jgi:hypothetical protein
MLVIEVSRKENSLEIWTCQSCGSSTLWKEREAVARTCGRSMPRAPTLPEDEQALDRFCTTWDAKYPAICPSVGGLEWQRLTVFFNYSPAICKVIYTTNVIESLSYSLGRLPKDAQGLLHRWLDCEGPLSCDHSGSQVVDDADTGLEVGTPSIRHPVR